MCTLLNYYSPSLRCASGFDDSDWSCHIDSIFRKTRELLSDNLLVSPSLPRSLSVSPFPPCSLHINQWSTINLLSAWIAFFPFLWAPKAYVPAHGFQETNLFPWNDGLYWQHLVLLILQLVYQLLSLFSRSMRKNERAVLNVLTISFAN